MGVMVTEIDILWDCVTFLVCIGALFYLSRLYIKFRGGVIGKAYTY